MWQTTTIEDLHELYLADTSYWFQVTTRAYVSRTWQMIIGVVERPVVAYCSIVAKVSSTELEANWNLSQLELELTVVSAGINFILPETYLRDTCFLLIMSSERPFKVWSLWFLFFCAYIWCQLWQQRGVWPRRNRINVRWRRVYRGCLCWRIRNSGDVIPRGSTWTFLATTWLVGIMSLFRRFVFSFVPIFRWWSVCSSFAYFVGLRAFIVIVMGHCVLYL